MKELLQFPTEFSAESTIDEEVNGGIESHQQVGNLKWKMMCDVHHRPFLKSAYLCQSACIEVEQVENVGNHCQDIAQDKDQYNHHQHYGQVLLLRFFIAFPKEKFAAGR